MRKQMLAPAQTHVARYAAAAASVPAAGIVLLHACTCCASAHMCCGPCAAVSPPGFRYPKPSTSNPKTLNLKTKTGGHRQTHAFVLALLSRHLSTAPTAPTAPSTPTQPSTTPAGQDRPNEVHASTTILNSSCTLLPAATASKHTPSMLQSPTGARCCASLCLLQDKGGGNGAYTCCCCLLAKYQAKPICTRVCCKALQRQTRVAVIAQASCLYG